MTMFDPQRVMDAQWAFSGKKQTDYSTLVSDANMTKAVAVIGSEIADLSRTAFTDQARFGKGHEFPTLSRELTRDIKYARTFDLSSMTAGYLAGFGMGRVVTSQPAVSTDPTVYQHVFSFFNPATAGKQVPVTTGVEIIPGPAGMLRRLESLAVSDFTISGKGREVCQAVVNFVGSGKVTTGADVSFPTSLSAVSLLDMGVMTFKLGTQGAPTDISTRLSSFSLKVNQSLDLANGYAPGSGLYRSRMWVGDRQVSLDATVLLDAANSDLLDRWNANTITEVQLYLDGDIISNAYRHACHIILPAVRMTAIPIKANGNLYEYGVSITKADVYKGAGGTPDEPLQITVISTDIAWIN